MKIHRPKSLIAAVLFTALFGSGTALAANEPPSDEVATASSDKDMSHDSTQPMNDTWITTKVKSELLADKDVKGMDIHVTTVNGVVTLVGELDSKTAVDKAIAVTKGVRGVKDVDAQALKVRGS